MLASLLPLHAIHAWNLLHVHDEHGLWPCPHAGFVGVEPGNFAELAEAGVLAEISPYLDDNIKW